jgi:hypothetical protein
VDTTVSPQIKIVALVGLVLALAGGGAMTLLGRSQETSAGPVATPSLPAATTPAAQKPKAASAAARHATTEPTPSAKPKPAARPKPAPKPKPPVAANGLPTPLDELLHTHRVVVVALYDGEVSSDKIARDEAHAGAVDADAGFLGVNVLDERVSSPLTALAGNGTLLPAPGILVYKRPGTLVNRIDGFADRVAVAEAVANALLASSSASLTPPAAAATTTAPATPLPLP